MKLVPFPHCCTAKILAGFGETDTADYGARPETSYTEESMFKEVVDKLEEAHRAGQAMVFATTNSEQKTANAVLPRVGFEKIEATAKAAHSGVQLLGWVFRLNLADKVRPLKVPKNPFTKGEKAAPNPALQFGDEEGEELPAPPEVLIQNGEQARRDEMRRIFRHVPAQVNPVQQIPMPPPLAINPAPAARARVRPAVGAARRYDAVIADEVGAAPYGPLTEPLQEGQVWDQFTPNDGEWMTINWEPGVGNLPEDKQFRIRRGRVGVERDWFEIHPNDQGRVNMVAVGQTAQLRVRLFGSHIAAPELQRRDVWNWKFDEDHRIGGGLITHFKVA